MQMIASNTELGFLSGNPEANALDTALFLNLGSYQSNVAFPDIHSQVDNIFLTTCRHENSEAVILGCTEVYVSQQQLEWFTHHAASQRFASCWNSDGFIFGIEATVKLAEEILNLYYEAIQEDRLICFPNELPTSGNSGTYLLALADRLDSLGLHTMQYDTFRPRVWQ